ncbi:MULTISPECIES: McrB family protein [Planktothricoides]|uniref:AAA family ATPase n=2 Tax=Planktothricoides raciborskii TaxID=132608 RepID=A0AAU8JCX5_9CYAN|nr:MULTISPECIES: AAA family ATPase [Planktothricoides]MBD2544842.1 AAA family ATPase [Planktothricoides raciborskii FACHB-1370]MBD2583062.1 AAA family ATPase [Planktothricoides raciborskii FACHB-1261]
MNSQNRTIDWLLAGCPTFAVTIVIALLLGQNMLKSGAIALATSATSVASAAIINGRQMTRLALLEQQITDNNKAEQLRAELPNLQAEYHKLSGKTEKINLLIKEKIKELEIKQASLGRAKGQLAELNQRSQDMKQAIAVITAQKQAIEQRVATLAKNYPDLDKLEQLQAKIAELQLQKAQLQGEIQGLEDKLAAMEYQKVLLRELEAKILDQRVEFERVTTQIQQLEARKKQQETENENLRNKGDRLRQQAIVYQAKLNKVEPENDPLESLKHPLWAENNSKLPVDLPKIISEEKFLHNFIQDIQAQGFYFPERLVRAFHTSLKVQGISALVVLSGISGTGKSELPQLYAKYIGAQFLLLAVQPRWDSPQDLLGFYNYMENQFKPTPLIQGIYQYNRSPELQDKIVLVLLDEMNLARVEYYFSEFLSKLETRRHHPAELEIDLGNCFGKLRSGDLKIPKQFLFVGTMNEDETTQTLSDKVLDRANVITFGQPPKLALINPQKNINDSRLSGYLTYEQFTRWLQKPEENSPLVKQLEIWLNKTNHVMAEMGHPFAHRVYQSIIYYVVNYPGMTDVKSDAFKWALADQFGQKILPKLRGLVISDESIQENLDRLGGIIGAIGDPNLETAFQRARQGYQFQWKGLAYQ